MAKEMEVEVEPSATPGLPCSPERAREMEYSDGLCYGDPNEIRYATGKRDAKPPGFPKVIPDISVGRRRRMINRP